MEFNQLKTYLIVKYGSTGMAIHTYFTGETNSDFDNEMIARYIASTQSDISRI